MNNVDLKMTVIVVSKVHGVSLSKCSLKDCSFAKNTQRETTV